MHRRQAAGGLEGVGRTQALCTVELAPVALRGVDLGWQKHAWDLIKKTRFYLFYLFFITKKHGFVCLFYRVRRSVVANLGVDGRKVPVRLAPTALGYRARRHQHSLRANAVLYIDAEKCNLTPIHEGGTHIMFCVRGLQNEFNGCMITLLHKYNFTYCLLVLNILRLTISVSGQLRS
jgi:hypothetical protein